MLVEIDDHRIEGVGLDGVADRLGDLPAVLDQLGEVAVLQILVELPLAQLVPAARLGHERQMGVERPRIAERFENEDLPRRVREMLLGADDVRDLEIVIVDHVGQVVEARAVGPLDDVVLLAGPIELDPAADQVVEHERALAAASSAARRPAGLRPRSGPDRRAFRP